MSLVYSLYISLLYMSPLLTIMCHSIITSLVIENFKAVAYFLFLSIEGGFLGNMTKNYPILAPICLLLDDLLFFDRSASETDIDSPEEGNKVTEWQTNVCGKDSLDAI
jgi:hypothetical protein